MVEAGPDDKIYPVGKLAAIVDALAAESSSSIAALDLPGNTQQRLAKEPTRSRVRKLPPMAELGLPP
jgi:hypothetical protein